MKQRHNIQRSMLRKAILSAIAAGIVATPAMAGIPDPVPVLPVKIAQEDVAAPLVPTTGIVVPANITWRMGVARLRNQDIQVQYTLDPGVIFNAAALPPVLTISNGAGAPPSPVGGLCALSSGGPGFGFAHFDCSLPAVGDIINVGNDLDLSGVVLDQTSGDLCMNGAMLGMTIQIIDNSGAPGINDVDNTDPPVAFPNGLIMVQPATSLAAIGEPTPGAIDSGDTSTDVFSLPTPLTAFQAMPNVGGAPDDSDVPSHARANFDVLTTDGTTLDLTGAVFNAGPQDVVDLSIDDPGMAFAGGASVCVGNGPFATCANLPRTFFDTVNTFGGGTTTSLGDYNSVAHTVLGVGVPGIPGSIAYLQGGPQNVSYTADGVNSMGVSRTLGMRGQITGNKGCVVQYPGNANWWPWKSNAFILEAHNVEHEKKLGGVRVERHTYTLTNNCASPIQAYIYVGNGNPAVDAVSCAGVNALGNECQVVIPGATGGQPGNLVKSINTITNAVAAEELTARFVIAGPPNCVHGAYEELDTVDRARKIEVMERDFGSPLDN